MDKPTMLGWNTTSRSYAKGGLVSIPEHLKKTLSGWTSYQNTSITSSLNVSVMFKNGSNQIFRDSLEAMQPSRIFVEFLR
jgi:hypothetical protein